MLIGEEVTALKRTQILEKAASWTNKKLDAGDLEFYDTSENAVAVLIYVTLDAEGRDIRDGGIVLFADDDSDGVITGQYAEVAGVWLYTVPKGGLYVDNAHVEYIKKKKPQEGLKV